MTKYMKAIALVSLFCLFAGVAQAQSIVGQWQLMKQSNCVDDEISMEGSGVEDVAEDMKAMSGGTPQVLELRENNSGQESTRIISKRKSYNSKSFLYRFDGSALYILDKKSRTIIEGFTVEKLDSDSLIISNTSRACETRVFVRIK
jgi:hypothetical protein